MRLTIVGNSMAPALREGDRVIVSCIPYLFSNPKAGDVIAARHPFMRRLIIKRIIKEVLPGHYFVAGDNPFESTDSDSFGPIPKSSILGKVLFLR